MDTSTSPSSTQETCQIILVPGLTRIMGDQIFIPLDPSLQLPGCNVRQTDLAINPTDPELSFGRQFTGCRVITPEIENVLVITQKIFQERCSQWLQPECLELGPPRQFA